MMQLMEAGQLGNGTQVIMPKRTHSRSGILYEVTVNKYTLRVGKTGRVWLVGLDTRSGKRYAQTIHSERLLFVNTLCAEPAPTKEQCAERDERLRLLTERGVAAVNTLTQMAGRFAISTMPQSMQETM